MKRWSVVLVLFSLWFSSKAAAQFNPAEVLPGVWQANIQGPYGPMTVKTVLLPDKTFNKTAQWSDKMTYEWGAWWIGDGFIRLEYAGHQPEYYKGRKMLYPDAESIFFTIIDWNHLRCEDRVLGTQWEVFRVRD